MTSALSSPWLTRVMKRCRPLARRTISRSRGQPPGPASRLPAPAAPGGAGEAGRVAGGGEQGGRGGGVGAGGDVPGAALAQVVAGDGGAARRGAVGVPGDRLGAGQDHLLRPGVGGPSPVAAAAAMPVSSQVIVTLSPARSGSHSSTVRPSTSRSAPG